jgi:predicted lipid-binding transport protein (Tim44 family)
VTPADFNTFEQRLAAVQAAYGSEDRDTIRSLMTPEMGNHPAKAAIAATQWLMGFACC